MSRARSPKKWLGPVRSNTGSSIRGKTISNPIPIVDDEFPIRTPGTGIAQPLGNEAVDYMALHRKSVSQHLEGLPHQTGIAISDFREPPTATPAPPVASSSPETPPRGAIKPKIARNSVASIPSGSSTGMGRPERKKSGIRSAFRKIFGRRKGSTSSKSESSADNKAGLHRSDPTALRSPNGSNLQQQRSASLPINEFNRALRSHSIVAEDLLPRNSGSDIKRDSAQTITDITGRPRRATTPSRLWTPNKNGGYVDWTGLSPRPASSHPRGSRIVSAGEIEANIGTAITSGNRYNPNRRSRSLGELRDSLDGRMVIRRRSDEIRYWRESYDPPIMSPMSSNKPEVEETIVLEDEDKENEAPREEPQPFNFGPLGELAGMKITQAASLETRVHQLEERMQSLERTVNANLRSHGEKIYLQDPPRRVINARSSSLIRTTTNESEPILPRNPRLREPQDAPQNVSNEFQSFPSSRPSTMSTNNSHHPSIDIFSTPAAPPSEPEKTPRPLSTSTTIRNPTSSSPTMPKDGVFTVEHYKALTNMILAEQAARQELEAQVRKLQQQLQAMRTSGPTSYPTPDSDQNRISSFLHHSATAGDPYSNFDREEDSSDDGRISRQEVFRTPNEETGRFGDEIFGEAVSHDRNEDLKSAPRTLSLSQITMGKGAQPGTEF